MNYRSELEVMNYNLSSHINQFENLGAGRAKLTGSQALNTYPGSQKFSTVWPVDNFIELGHILWSGLNSLNGHL